MSATTPRLLRKARGLRRRATRRWRIARSPRAGFLETNHDYHRTLLLVGSARSGSTWLSDVLEETLRCRMVFEPLRRDKVPLAAGVPWGRFSDPADSDPALDLVLHRILTGRVRSRWSDKFNRVRLPRRRLVKEIRATNLLPRILARYPGMPVVYLLRHPVPTAWSAADLHWKPYLGEFLSQTALMDGPLAPYRSVIETHAKSDDPFERHVLRWCLENYVPVHRLAPGSLHVVFYENILENPEVELARLGRYLEGFAEGGWVLPSQRPEAWDQPSRANYRGTPALDVETRLRAWQEEVTPTAVAVALEIVAAFGLDRLYGAGIRPLLEPDAVLLGPAANSS